MKRIFFTAALLLTVVFSGVAQNRKIEFEPTRDWKQIVEKAKAENKLIFVDCYTDWCGPCKMLDANVFTQDAVADFFNENFVNSKFEMQKDEHGPILSDTYFVGAYPTMLFIDPVTEELVHRLTGAGTAEWLIQGGHDAMDSDNSFSAMEKRYNSGERGSEFVAKYLAALKSAYMREERARVAKEYLATFTLEQLATPEGFLTIRENESDPLSYAVRQVMENRQMFYDISDRETVDRFLEYTIMGSATELARWTPKGDREFDSERNAELMKYLKSIDFPATTPALAHMETGELVRNGKWKSVVKKVEDVRKTNAITGDDYFGYLQFNMEALARSNNEKIIAQGVKVLNEEIARQENFYRKASLAQSKVRLYNSIGNKVFAEAAGAQEEEFTKQGDAAGGGRTQRAVRMN